MFKLVLILNINVVHIRLHNQVLWLRVNIFPPCFWFAVPIKFLHKTNENVTENSKEAISLLVKQTFLNSNT